MEQKVEYFIVEQNEIERIKEGCKNRGVTLKDIINIETLPDLSIRIWVRI